MEMYNELSENFESISKSIKDEIIKDDFLQRSSTIETESKTDRIIQSAENTILAAGSAISDFFTASGEVTKDLAISVYNNMRGKNNLSTDVSSNKNNGISNEVPPGQGEGDGTSSETGLEEFFGKVDEVSQDAVLKLKELLGNLPANSSLAQLLKGMGTAALDNLTNYKDGVTETTFGSYMEDSWSGPNESFLNYFSRGGGAYKVNWMTTDPLDPGKTRSSLFGTHIMGTPFLMNTRSDPANRTMINSFVKDGRFVSFTPGMPQYHGSQFSQKDSENIYKQTRTPDEMLRYLIKNGLDADFSMKDKRYYTFKESYSEYFAYLEGMLNPLWLKMGLAKGKDTNEFNLFSFFKIRDEQTGHINPENKEVKYSSSIGFFCEPSSAISESVDNDTLDTGSELAGQVNQNSAFYQRLNYLSGMGTGGSVKNVTRNIVSGHQSLVNIKNAITGDLLNNAKSGWKSGSYYGEKKGGKIGAALLGGAGFIAGAALDVAHMSANNDLGAIVQSIGVSNGMKVVYPELWGDSRYSKNINLNFSFVSPYGDPLSIFKYVYVPFCALCALGLPRQAAENGYVSPFFVRADVPGVFTSDLALISSISWVKGTGNNLWTKDGLPRGIDVSITLTDLYPYLAMTKRFSFLSANPSYTVFLDNMAGLCALNRGEENGSDPLDKYFQNLVNRVSGSHGINGLWNEIGVNKADAINDSFNRERTSVTSMVDYRTVPWLHNSSL